MKPSLKKLNSKDLVLQTLQSNLETVLNFILNCPMIDGVPMQVVFTANQDMYVNHGLGRPYQGVLQSLTNNFVNIKISDTTNLNKDKTIILQSTGSGVVNLWLY